MNENGDENGLRVGESHTRPPFSSPVIVNRKGQENGGERRLPLRPGLLEWLYLREGLLTLC